MVERCRRMGIWDREGKRELEREVKVGKKRRRRRKTQGERR